MAYLSLAGLRPRSIVFSLYSLYCRRALISIIFIHGYADDLQIHSHYLAPKISQLTKWHTHFIHVASHFILSNLAGVWSRGTFDPIVINGETISNTIRDLGVYINSSINLADHVRSQANNEDLLLQIRQSRSIHLLLTIKFCGGHVKISRPRSKLDPWNFAISSPSVWNFLQVYLPDPGFSRITLRWNLNAFLSSLFICSSNALHNFYVFKLPAAFIWDNF